MVINIHIDEYPEKFTYLWHNNYFFKMQRYTIISI